MNSLNILQINSGRGVNGALVYCKLLSSHLRDLGHCVSVLTRPDSWLKGQLESSDIPCITSEMTRFPTGELQRISQWITHNQIDIIHTHMSRGHSFGVLLKLMTGVPVVATAHSRSIQLHWKLNDYVIANSHATCAYQQRINRISPSKLETVHCFSDLGKFKDVPERSVQTVRRQLRLAGNEFVIGVVGDVIARKGQLYLAQALATINNAVPNFKLVILGRFHRNEPYTKQIRSLLIRNGLYRKTKWLGVRSNVEDFMSLFDVCVVPSIEEPLGLVAIEAMAVGTPVVATNVGGLPEIVRHDVNGLLVEPRNPSELAAAIIRLAQDPDLRKRLGDHGRPTAFAQFDPAVLTQQVISVYQRVLARRHAA
jgi:glycosyltransferase involved in cell wall biosynthesis